MISLISPSEVKQPTSIAIGSFDGLHEGHRRLIKTVVEKHQHTPTVASFWPHPREILYRETRLRLDLPEEKLPLLERLGIEQLVLIPFTHDLSKLSAENFVKKILKDQLQAKHISVGANFRFGFKRQGDINTMRNITKELNIQLEVVSVLKDNEGRISSSRVRKLLQEGDLNGASKLLNRHYKFTGKVVKGKGLGKNLGFPTANLEIDGRKFLPGEGVYAAWATINNSSDKLAAVMNLGKQPTIDPLSPSAVEVHLINKNINLYGSQLSIQPVSKIRSQKTFSNLNELSGQISSDRDLSLKILMSKDKEDKI